MLPYILIGIAALIALFLLIVAMQPAAFKVVRSAKIAAPPETVFAQVNDFHNWDAWSPWAKIDPDCRNSFEGAPAGQGAVFSWDGNKKVGAGRMTITDSRPAEKVRIKLEFFRPFKCENAAEFTFTPVGSDQTQVNWAMTGQKNFMFKAFCMFANMDKAVGGDFEKGLAAMKAVSEGATVRA
ncbi:MAG TPA: SRPBCC family protein [Tepidisphaeraceae bacterium]|jgi:uncharacterized protein YndB with AHSA1/START domain